MRTINFKKVLDNTINNYKALALIFVLILTTIFSFINYTNINQELKNKEYILNENENIIFYTTKAKETNLKINTFNNKINYLNKEVDKLQTYEECIENQLDRLVKNQEINLEYCENKKEVTKNTLKENKIEKVTYKKTDQEVIKNAMELIKNFEWVKYKAYWDVKQYSICYGTKSIKWATANKEECNKMLKERVQNELLRINRLADNLDPNKKIALISFFYNVGYKIDILNYARKGDDDSVIYLMSLYNSAGGKYLPWLQKRRNAEIKIYNWKTLTYTK